MHSSVCFVKLNDDGRPKRIVISHFMDITDHRSAQAVANNQEENKENQEHFPKKIRKVKKWDIGLYVHTEL